MNLADLIAQVAAQVASTPALRNMRNIEIPEFKTAQKVCPELVFVSGGKNIEVQRSACSAPQAKPPTAHRTTPRPDCCPRCWQWGRAMPLDHDCPRREARPAA